MTDDKSSVLEALEEMIEGRERTAFETGFAAGEEKGRVAEREHFLNQLEGLIATMRISGSPEPWVKLLKVYSSKLDKTYWVRSDTSTINEATPIGELGLTTATSNALQRESIYTVGDIATTSVGTMNDVRNFGEVKFRDLFAIMGKIGYYLVTREE